MTPLFTFLILLGLSPYLATASEIAGMDFRANFYQRDLSKNTVIGRGKAWIKKEGKEIWADEIEVDFNLNRAFANGNVHIKDGETDIFCDRGNYSLNGEDATLENATLLFGQTVLSGLTLHKINLNQFEMEEGIYTNCNIVPYADRDAGKCAFDIKIYGRRFHLTVDGYIHIYDAILYAKELPVFYLPYFVAPAKTKRESGFLMPSVSYRDHLGTGVSIPYFWALSSWHDLTLSPTYWSKAETHLGLEYNYAYSRTKLGSAKVYLLQRPFGTDLSQPWIRPSSSDQPGILSEEAFDIHNTYSLGGRAYSRQDLSWVSNKYWTGDFPEDFGANGDFQYLRSNLSVTSPSDNSLLTVSAQAEQPLIATLDTGADQGSVSQLPDIRLSRKTTNTFFPYFSFDIDSRLTNFFRPGDGYDHTPLSRIVSNQIDNNPDYHFPNFIRTGRRLWLEPRLTANVPLASGFQLQPLLKTGMLGYYFDLPQSSLFNQTYVETEIPFSLYMSKVYHTGISGYESINHVIQPRILFASTLYRSPTPTHPFFSVGGPDPFDPISNDPNNPPFVSPRFDYLDQNQEQEYMRIEFNNRLLRKVISGSERFLLFQIANSYYLKPSSDFNNGVAGVGPIEVLVDTTFGPFSAQLQGNYYLTAVTDQLHPPLLIHPNDWTSTISYSSGGDRIWISSLFRTTALGTDNDQALTLNIYKTLPMFMDVFGSIERSFLWGKTKAFSLGFLFASKPRSCWSLSLVTGQTAASENYAKFIFGLTFGGTAGFSTGQMGK